jgi:iron complex outermembrane receptor protein
VTGTALPVLAADEPVEVMEIVGSPTETVQRRAVTGFAAAIDPETHAEQLETLSDALAESVGVQVRRFGGLGAFSTMSIRGSSANQVQIYLDGIPLSRARNETVNLADLPLDSLQRIEVYRGTAPVMFGAGGIGGVVNLVTKPPSTEPVTDLAAGYGSFETRKVVVAHTRKVGPVELLAFLTYLGSKGDFTFLDDRGTEQNPDDDRETTRHDNAFDSVEGLVKGAWSSADGLRLDLTSEVFFKDQGLAGAGNRNDLPQSASLRDLRTLNYLRATRPGLLSERLDLTGTVFGIYERLGLSDRQNKLGGGNQDGRDMTSVVGGNLGATYSLADFHAVECMTEVSHERLAPFSELSEPTNYPDQTRWHAALAVQDRVAFFDERVLVAPTLRYEHLHDSFTDVDIQGRPVPPRHTNDRDLWTPALGISLHPQPWLLLKANISRQQRAPNFSELFGRTGTVTGESKLKPETAINRDVGLVLEHRPQHWLDRVRLEYAYFNNDIDNLIVLRLLGQGRFKPQNVNGARVRGHEVSLSTTWLGHLDLDANYTHQESENLNPDYRHKELPLRPADELYTRLTFFGSPGKLFYEFNLVDGNYLDSANYDHVPERDVHTIGLTLTPWESLALTFEVRNLTDNQISDVGKFPLPGRSFFGTVKLTM